MRLTGRIFKGIGGFYYIHTSHGIIECRARGKFRKENIIPKVGDIVDLDTDNFRDGYIIKIHKRINELVRPPVSNVDQAIITFAINSPSINRLLLDKMLVIIELNNIFPVICINKVDLDFEGLCKKICKIYQSVNYTIILTSKVTGEGINRLKDLLNNKISFFTGPSGVGKSSLINSLQNFRVQETGDLSTKILRGKQTTRNIELIPLEKGYILDTPGFTSLKLDINVRELKYYFREFKKYESGCKYSTCLHVNEPNCSVKDAVSKGYIDEIRYMNYLYLLKEIKSNKRSVY